MAWTRAGIWLAASLAAVGLPQRPAAADDDTIVPPTKASPRQPAGVAADQDPRRAGPFVVSLSNGDRLTGRILSLDAERLEFRPDVARDVELAIRLPRLRRIEPSRGEEPVEPRGDRVYPLAGGVIHGPLIGLTARSLKLDAHLVGRVQLPLATLAAFVRDGRDLPIRTAAPELYEVVVRGGTSRSGMVALASDGLTISHGSDSTSVSLAEVEAILFPSPEQAPALAPAVPEQPPGCVIKILNGSELVGSQPELDHDLISVAMAGGVRVAVPLAHLEVISFEAPEIAFAAPRRVIFWTTCADADEEAKHMANALAEGLPKSWQLDAEATHPELGDLEADLLKAGVLVIPEMEKFARDNLPDPERLGKVLRTFLERGGTVVLAGVGDGPDAYWKAAGLVSLNTTTRVTKGDFRFAKATPLAEGVGDSFPAVNATYAYQTDDESFEPVAVREGGPGAAVLVKRCGRGSLILLGMDYYATSGAVNRVLVNAVTLQRSGH